MEQGGCCVVRFMPSSVVRPQIQTTSYPALQNSLPRFRTIAPRNTGAGVLSNLEVSGVEDGVLPPSPEHLLTGKKKRKRDIGDRMKKKIKNGIGPVPIRPIKPMEMERRYPVLDLSLGLEALDGTPLGKLLKATPDIRADLRGRQYGARGAEAAGSTAGRAKATTAIMQSYLTSTCSELRPLKVKPAPLKLKDSSEAPHCHQLPVRLPLILPSAGVAFSLGQNAKSSSTCSSELRLGVRPAPLAFPVGSLTTPATGGYAVGNNAQSSDMKLESLFHPMDTVTMEQKYGSAEEPVMVTDEAHKLLWSNQAFKRAVEGTSWASGQVVLPLPPQLSNVKAVGHFWYHATKFPASPAVKATLWEFLKEVLASNYHQEPISSSAVPKKEPQVITPQPVRAVGSAIQIMDLSGRRDDPIRGNLDSVKKACEMWSMPVIWTDRSNRVRWVNSAYSRMIGQPECSWLPLTLGDNETCSSSMLMGEVKVGGLGRLSFTSPAYHCTSRLNWEQNQRKCLLHAPCVATRVDGLDSEPVGYIWQFNVSSATHTNTCT